MGGRSSCSAAPPPGPWPPAASRGRGVETPPRARDAGRHVLLALRGDFVQERVELGVVGAAHVVHQLVQQRPEDVLVREELVRRTGGAPHAHLDLPRAPAPPPPGPAPPPRGTPPARPRP